MGGKWTSWLSAVAVAVGVGGTAAVAAPPWGKLLTVNRVEADPNKEYRLTEQNGPWMIVACSFSGDGADQQAQALAVELRKRYKLPAYTHQMKFEFRDAQGRGIDQFGAPIKMRHRRDDLREVAVLVGDYPAVDDPEAQRTMQKLKYTRPPCLEVSDGKATNQTLAGWRWTQRQVQKVIGSQQKDKGPMSHAFVTTNPMLPKDYYVSKGLDPLVLEMNQGVKHSLLDCPGKYTVLVATFKGQVIIKQDEIKAVENGKQLKSELAEAAMKAHRLTEALRLKGYEAYEFHDRYASIVTVGSFDSVGSPRPDGRTEINPRVHAVMKDFGAEPAQFPGSPGNCSSVKSLLGIPFDIQPVPVEVPKRSISHEMARGQR